MARKYPNDFTPSGSSIQEAFVNDDSELKNIINKLDNMGAAQKGDATRNSILACHTSAGVPDFLIASNLHITLDGSATPLILTFANGFSEFGAVDSVRTIDTLVSQAWTIPANYSAYLYVDVDATSSLISYGTSPYAPAKGNIAPEGVIDQHYFNELEGKMYRYNGSLWEQISRVFVGRATSTDTTISLDCYAPESLAKIAESKAKLWAIILG